MPLYRLLGLQPMRQISQTLKLFGSEPGLNFAHKLIRDRPARTVPGMLNVPGDLLVNFRLLRHDIMLMPFGIHVLFTIIG